METFREPEGERYAHSGRIGAGGKIAPQAFPDAEILLDEVVP